MLGYGVYPDASLLVACLQPAGHEAEVLQADELMKDKKVTEAGALYKKVYNELAQGNEPSPLLQARCLAGLGASWHIRIRSIK